MGKEVKEKQGKKKIIIITVIVGVILLLGIGSVFAVKVIKEKIEYDKIILEVKEEKIELNYGEKLEVNELLIKYEGGELSIENNIDFEKIGEYKVIYKATNENNTEKTKEVLVNIVDNKVPTIKLDKKSVNVKLNDKVDLLSGVKAEDNYDKDITEKVTVTGNVDVTKEGTYEIKYDVIDSSGNSAETKVRTYTVKKEPTLQIGKTYEWTSAQGGATITLQKNNNVKSTSWATNGGASDYKGTYKIEGNKLTITYLQMYDLMEWVDLEAEYRVPETYTITDDNQFKDSDGRVYKMK